MTIFNMFKKSKRVESPPFYETHSEASGTAEWSAAGAEKEANKKRGPLHLGSLRYVNYNTQTQNCSLEKALDLGWQTGKPIFAHFIFPAVDDSAKFESERVAEIFSDSKITMDIEDCFVPAVFNTEECNSLDEYGKAMIKMFGRPPVGQSPMHFLRIITCDGKRVVVGTDDITDKDAVRCLMMKALEELNRHVPKTLYTSVRRVV